MSKAATIRIVIMLVVPDGSKLDITPAMLQDGLSVCDGDAVFIDIPGRLEQSVPLQLVLSGEPLVNGEARPVNEFDLF